MDPDDSQPATPEDRGDDLVAEALQHLESEGLAGMEAWLAGLPEAETVRARLAALHAAGLLPVPEGDPLDSLPERLGDFRLLARLGGGGMGLVYLARQESLGRQVALKVVRPELLFHPGARERFAREVAAIARLGHPGIMPVHSVGEERGVPFFVMEHVRGATLAEVIESVAGRDLASLAGSDLRAAVIRLAATRLTTQAANPGTPQPPGSGSAGIPGEGFPRTSDAERMFAGSWSSVCLRIAARVASALAHAHERGVLHRDIKPSNVLVTPDGRVLLFDFGLASSEGSERLTRSGLRLGSLAYMSPEQLDGHAEVDERSDVYALGVTLYELLTLRLPFDHGNGEALAAAIRGGQPRPLRELNGAVPRDVETVTSCAMDRDRGRRYPSASALAADLDNVLEHRPVTARRQGPWLRLRRLMQRRPAASVAVLMGALILVAGPALWALQQQRAAAVETRERERAERAMNRALDAVDTLLLRVGDETLRNVPGFDQVRIELLRDALRLHEELLTEDPGDRRLSLAVMESSVSLGLLLDQVGELAASRVAYERALELALQALTAWPTDVELMVAAGKPLGGLLSITAKQGDAAAHSTALQTALALSDQAVALRPDWERVWHMRAEMFARQAQQARVSGNSDEATEANARARDAATQALRLAPDDTGILHSAVKTLTNAAGLLMTLGQHADARPLLLEAVEHARRHDLLAPGDRSAGLAFVAATTSLANLDAAAGRPEEALQALTVNLSRAMGLHALHPDDSEIVRMVSGTTLAMSGIASRLGRSDEALGHLSTTEAMQRHVVELHPESAQFLGEYALTCNNLGAALLKAGRATEALAALDSGIEATIACLKLQPHYPQGKLMLRSLHQHACTARLDLDDFSGLRATVESMVQRLADDGDCLRIAAGQLSLALGLSVAREDEGLAAVVATRAVELVQAARTLGALSDTSLASAPAFANLRSRPEYAALGPGND